MIEDFNFPRQRTATGLIQTTINVTPEFYKLAKECNIKFSDALKIGLSLMFADRGIIEYDNNLNLHRKMMMFKIKLEETAQELNELKQKADNGVL